jgi:hypothetical protein
VEFEQKMQRKAPKLNLESNKRSKRQRVKALNEKRKKKEIEPYIIGKWNKKIILMEEVLQVIST